MISIADLRQQDGALIGQQMDLEAQFVAATGAALRAAVVARFGARAGARGLGAGDLRDWGESYAQGMLVSLLYGALHARRLLEVQAPAGRRLELAEKWSMPFAEAETALLSQVAITKDQYEGLSAAAKFRAFTIARVGDEDIVRRVQALYQRQLAEGADRAALLRDLRPLLAEAGIGEANPWWLQTHYRNNMMAAYNAGRHIQLEGNPLVAALQYDAIRDDATTELCNKLDGTILRVGDPQIASITPPNHHQCRSVWTPLMIEMMRAAGLRVTPAFDIAALRRANPVLEREHQFRASSAATLDVVPRALAERATKYGKWPDILRFTARAARAHIGRRVRAVREADSLPPDVRAHADAGQVWLGTATLPDGGVRPMLHLVQPAGRRGVSVVRIGLQRGAGAAYNIAAGAWARLKEVWQRVE